MSLSLSENRKRELRQTLIIGLTLALAGIGGVGAAWYLKKPPPPLVSEVVSDLELSPEHLNFGEVWEDSQFSIALPVTNHRTQAVQIKRFLKSCNCSRIEPPSLTIPAGETRKVRVMLDLAPRKVEELGKLVRDFEVSISPVLADEADGGKSIWWTIRGRVRSVIQCEPPFVDFGRVSESADPLPSKRATIKSFAHLRDISATCSSPLFDAKVERQTTKGSEPTDLIIRPRGPLPKGQIRFTVALKPVSTDGKSFPAKEMHVVGQVVGDIEASPPTVMFGACPVGKTMEETVSLRSLTGRPFNVAGMRCEGTGLSVEQIEEATASFPTFRIAKSIGMKGEQQGKVIFSIRSNGGKESEVAVVLSWCGTEGGNK